MKKKLIIVAVGALVICGLLLSSGALAGKSENGVSNGNGMPSGEHYNLNIIGVSKDKNPDAEGWINPNRHTIFVPLERKTNIYMMNGSDFAVIDADGTDDGKARFQLETGYYEVYAAALGKPGKWVIITPNASYEEGYEIQDQYFALDSITLGHNKKPRWERVTGLFLVNVWLKNTETGEIKEYTNKWIFDIPELFEYWWEYDNHGQKLVQVRFYPVEEEPLP